MVGLNSLWGSIWSIAEKTGWTVDYILWRVSWVNLRLMLADAPRIDYSKTKEKRTLNTEADMDAFFNK